MCVDCDSAILYLLLSWSWYWSCIKLKANYVYHSFTTSSNWTHIPTITTKGSCESCLPSSVYKWNSSSTVYVITVEYTADYVNCFIVVTAECNTEYSRIVSLLEQQYGIYSSKTVFFCWMNLNTFKKFWTTSCGNACTHHWHHPINQPSPSSTSCMMMLGHDSHTVRTVYWSKYIKKTKLVTCYNIYHAACSLLL